MTLYSRLSMNPETPMARMEPGGIQFTGNPASGKCSVFHRWAILLFTIVSQFFIAIGCKLKSDEGFRYVGTRHVVSHSHQLKVF